MTIETLLTFSLGLDTDLGRAPALGRANTTLNVASNARERTAGGSPSEMTPPVVRSNTMAAPGGAGMGGPVRGLSVRKAGPAGGALPPPPPLKG